MHQHDPDLARIDLRVVGRHAADEVVELRDDLHPRESAAGDDEGQELSAQLLVVSLDGRLLEGPDDVVAQIEGVVEVLEGQGVLRQSPQAAEVGDGPQRKHQVVVLDDMRMGQEARSRGDGPPFQIDGFDLADVDLRSGEQPAKRTDQVEQADGSRDHFRQHRLEDEVVVLGDEDDFVIAAAGQLALQLLRGKDGAESAAEDDDALRPCCGLRVLLAEDAAHAGRVIELRAAGPAAMHGRGGEHAERRREEIDPQRPEPRAHRGGQRPCRVHARPGDGGLDEDVDSDQSPGANSRPSGVPGSRQGEDDEHEEERDRHLRGERSGDACLRQSGGEVRGRKRQRVAQHQPRQGHPGDSADDLGRGIEDRVVPADAVLPVVGHVLREEPLDSGHLRIGVRHVHVGRVDQVLVLVRQVDRRE